MTRALKLILPTILSVILALPMACDSGGGENEPDLRSEAETTEPTTDETSPGDVDFGDYPAGPYGTEEGTIIANHSFFNPETGKDISFAELRAAGEKQLLFVTSGAGWCSACKQEAVELKAKYIEYGPQGLEIWSTLFQDFVGDPADEGFWNVWKGQLTPNYPLLLDADFVLNIYFNPDSAPMNMLIRLETMEILFLQTGFDPAVVEAQIKKFLE
jgi:hypothetical protein